MNKNNISKNNFIYIGGSNPQIAGILCAKSAGLNVVLTDRSINAPAKEVSEKYENISAIDIQGLIRLALRLNKEMNFVGAYGVADYAYEGIGAIYEKLKLPYGSRELFKKMSNKNISREIWNAAGISIPKGLKVVNNKIDISKLILPLIVKPSNSYNSQGLKTIKTHKDLNSAITNALKYSDTIVCEEFIEGKHYNVDMVFIDGEAFPAGITERFFVNDINHQALSGIQGSEFDGLNNRDIYDLVINACKAIGFNYGPVTADLIKSGNSLYILELSPHFHSISVSRTIKLDKVLKGWFSYLAGNKNWRNIINFSSNLYSCYFYILTENEGVIKEIEGIDLIKSIPGLVEIDLKYNIGSKIKKNDDNKIYCGTIIIKSEKYQELFDNLDFLSKSLKVITNEK